MNSEPEPARSAPPQPPSQPPSQSSSQSSWMPPPASSDSGPPGTLLPWRRVRFVAFAALPFGLMQSTSSTVTPAWVWILRVAISGWCIALAFGLAERWPRQLPRRLARWVWQLMLVVPMAPLGALVAYWLTTGTWTFWHDPQRLTGYSHLAMMGLLFAPWIAVAAQIRQRDASIERQAVAFQLERLALERQAIDARLRLLQAQVQPHFLFNTLANVRALVNAGSPRASEVLDSLIAYLRAAVPRLNEPATTLAHEVELVRAYLALMHLRMPDRLRYSVQLDADAEPLRCPAMAVLTLVENAIRHGVDPSEEGGHIHVHAGRRGARCVVTVMDTGVGLGDTSDGLGTGLATLRERLRLIFGEDASLRLTSVVPQGACAEIDMPADPLP